MTKAVILADKTCFRYCLGWKNHSRVIDSKPIWTEIFKEELKMGLLNEYANTALSEMQQVFDRMDDKDLQPALDAIINAEESSLLRRRKRRPGVKIDFVDAPDAFG